MSDIFDPTEVVENTFPFAKPGVYRALVENAEIKTTKKGTGRYVQANLTLIDGAEKGIRVMSFFNFDNPNMTAQGIGRNQLKRFLASVGITTAVDLQTIGQLVKNKVVSVELEVEDGMNGPQNRPVDFLPPGSVTKARLDAVTDEIPF